MDFLTENKINYIFDIKEILYDVIVILFTFGIVALSLEYSRLALVLYFIWCFIYKENLKLKEMCSNKLFHNTIKVISIFLVVFIFTNVMNGNCRGVDEAFHFLERFITAGSFYIIIYRRNKIYVPILIGMIIGSIYMGYPQVLKYLFNIKLLGIRHHNDFAAWVICVVPFLFTITVSLNEVRKKIILVMCGLIVGFCCIMILFMSPSRGGSIGFCFLILLSTLFIKNKTIKYCIIVFLVLSSVFAYMYISNRYSSVRGGDFERILFWRSSWQMFLDYPLFGIGHGNWHKYYMIRYCFAQFAEYYPGHPHNMYLYILAENGFIGLSGFLLLLISCVRFCYSDFKKYGLHRYSFTLFLILSGTIIHNMVDVSFFVKWFMLMISFFWCIVLNQCNMEI